MKTTTMILAYVLLTFAPASVFAQGNSGNSNGIPGRVAALEANNASLQAQVDALQLALDALLTDFGTHTGDPAAHHGRYTDAQAVTAVGPHTDADSIITEIGPHTVPYTDTQAVTAVGPHTDGDAIITEIGPHFGGDHADLTNVSSSQHHADQASQVDQLQDLLVHFSRSGNEITITGANLHVVNGLGSTTTTNTLGNVIIGYNETRGSGDDRSGSHMLVVGKKLNYTKYGGVVVGEFNTTSGNFSSVKGGNGNTASGTWSSVSGGIQNTASGDQSSVSGGAVNTASNRYSSVSGGRSNTASGSQSSVSGGFLNTASETFSSVKGGHLNAPDAVNAPHPSTHQP